MVVRRVLYTVKEIFDSYCDINIIYNYTEKNITDLLDQGIPVATGKFTPNKNDSTIVEKHMVTIIGYSDYYFYVAAGNPECSANMIPRGSLRNERNWFSSCLYYISK